MTKKQKMISWMIAAAVLVAACAVGIIGVNAVRNKEYSTYRALYKDTYKKMADIYIVLRNNSEQVLLDFGDSASQQGEYQFWFTEDDAISTQEDFEQLRQEAQTQVEQLAKVPRKQKKIYQEYYNMLKESHQNMQQIEALISAPGGDKKAFQSKLEELEHSIDTAFEYIYQGFPVSQKEIGSGTFLKLAAYWSSNTLELN